MNKNAKRVVLSGMAVIMMVSCGTAKKGGQSDTVVASKGDMEAIDNDYLILSDAQRDLLAKNNTFAINLFNKTNGMDSRVISPLSVTGLMTILANGADGDTRQEILNTLGWTEASMEEINEIYGLLVKQAGIIDPSVTVNVADYVAVNKDNRINNEFGKTVGDLFGTEVRNLDFSSPKTVNTINGLVLKAHRRDDPEDHRQRGSGRRGLPDERHLLQRPVGREVPDEGHEGGGVQRLHPRHQESQDDAQER